MAIPDIDKKILWGRSGNRCAFPECKKELTFEKGIGIIGEMAHIVARNKSGPRGDAGLPAEKIDGYFNLILLCPDHHTLIDKNEKEWTVAKLEKIKMEHEEWVESQLSKGFFWRMPLSTIHYLNVPRIIFDLASKGKIIDLSHIEKTDFEGLYSLGLELAGLIITFKKFFSSWKPEALDIYKEGVIAEKNIGARVKFYSKFRTKNIPLKYKFTSGAFKFFGDIKKDPHIYCTVGQFKVYFSIDPRWITTNTAFNDFSPEGGQKTFAGLGLLKHVDDKMAVITPLVLGLA